MFLGISIVADIFMEAIEVITSKTTVIDVYDDKGENKYQIEVPQWNATMANLTLMAFGSSAPEILLSVSEATQTLGQPASELGAATIVGSAAFNLLVISAVSVVAVGETPKKINDLGVFAVTSIFSVFAYLWLYYVLGVRGEGTVDRLEAWLTFGYFLILLVLAYGFDKLNQRKQSKIDDEVKNKSNDTKLKKSNLRSFARARGEQVVIECAQGIKNKQTQQVPEQDQREIRDLFREVIGVPDLGQCNITELLAVLQPETLFERFAARKANKIGAGKDFLAIKGQKGLQMENAAAVAVKTENEIVGFKCLHYSVTESSGIV